MDSLSDVPGGQEPDDKKGLHIDAWERVNMAVAVINTVSQGSWAIVKAELTGTYQWELTFRHADSGAQVVMHRIPNAPQLQTMLQRAVRFALQRTPTRD